MTDLIIRFLIGGMVVSSFALLSEIFRPKSFAGLFGAAPPSHSRRWVLRLPSMAKPMQPWRRAR